MPARASVGITCVLTMMTLTTSCIGSLPTNQLYTPVDVYLGACFIFVFGALLEFAAVNFTETSLKVQSKQLTRIWRSVFVDAMMVSETKGVARAEEGWDAE